MSTENRMNILERNNMPVLLRELFDLIESRYVRREAYDELKESVWKYIQEVSLMHEVDISIDDNGNIVFMTANENIDLDLLGLENGNLVLYDDDSESGELLEHLVFSVEDGYSVVTYNFET